MPLKSKRNHSEVEHEEEQVSNKDLLNAISNLTNRMTDVETKIAQMVDEKIAGMEKNIMEQVTVYKQGTNDRVQRIEKRMDEFIQQVAIDMNVARDENCKIIEEKIDHSVAKGLSSATGGITESRMDQLERQVRMNELVISGVPFQENENLCDIITSVCRAINYNGGVDSIESSFRLPVRRNTRNSSPSIIVKFWGSDAKNFFFKQYFSSKELCASKIGFTVPSRIYVNENLTKRNFDIFRKVRELKKDGKIARFNTQRGRVVVKFQDAERMHAIESLDHLGSLLVSSATATTSMNK